MGKFRNMFSPDKSLRKNPNPLVPDQLQISRHSLTREDQPSLSESFPDGVKVLRDCPDATVDICFIHGLSGNREKTWRGHGHSEPWPKTLLPSKLTRARILTYGYDAYVVAKSGPASTNRLIDHATNLLNDLTTDRALSGASSRPLIFVVHSLGGLVLKAAILRSRNNPDRHLRGIFEHTKGIVFMGTPHKGSWMADWARMPASALGLIKSTSVTLLDLLQRDNQLLESIQVEFWSMIRDLRESGRSLEIMCFYEELPLPVVGKVVSKESATLEGYNSATIHANHRDMVKFGSVEDNGFKRLLGELSRWESQIRPSIPSQLTQPTLVEPRIELPGSSVSDYSSRDYDAGLQTYGGQTSGSNPSYGYSSWGSGNQSPGHDVPRNPAPTNTAPVNHFSTSGGTQNNNTGSGYQFSGATFTGQVYFGGQGS
ncbi:Alpha/Beta hydrolase protein [Fusarium solani]|jgi:pimeloyl-ACP methyl ester carboxylesterase|uniref:Alpha/Beta hydrolase protein n=1 Tax=Fusarium solani TaxID=169388 RepID=A0A9P9KGE9_FUSSL|nr:Alpha/Beta hydrolase protein [Fusarium solani]KAH7260608.1 Alpha/Beta hydrolase protein [Fusarium solani]